MLDVEELYRQWNAWGEQDPLFAVLSHADKRGGGWDIGEFLATGRDHIDQLLDRLETMGLSPARGSALDFGCGVGRLTLALSDHFEHVVGVDVAPSMIALAEKLDASAGRCEFIVNPHDHLQCLDDGRFDLVVAFIVLQHMPPDLAKRYLAELVRVLAPGGILVFQLPGGAEHVPAIDPLPTDAFRAEVGFLAVPAAVPARSYFPVTVTVRNDSPQPWPVMPDNRINVANHWLDAAGSCLHRDDGRTGLPRLEPGAAVDLRLRCTTPTEPGDYLLEVDLVQEGVTWFAERGSPSARVMVTVVETTTGIESDEVPVLPALLSSDPPKMETFTVPIGDVVALLEAQGAVIQSIQKDASAGDWWRSYEYIATLKRK